MTRTYTSITSMPMPSITCGVMIFLIAWIKMASTTRGQVLELAMAEGVFPCPAGHSIDGLEKSDQGSDQVHWGGTFLPNMIRTISCNVFIA